MGNATLGNVSLLASILGSVLPMGLVSLSLLIGPTFYPQEAHVLSFILFVIFEIVAFGCGIAARGATSGKVGLAISAVLLPLVLAAVCAALYWEFKATWH